MGKGKGRRNIHTKKGNAGLTQGSPEKKKGGGKRGETKKNAAREKGKKGLKVLGGVWFSWFVVCGCPVILSLFPLSLTLPLGWVGAHGSGSLAYPKGKSSRILRSASMGGHLPKAKCVHPPPHTHTHTQQTHRPPAVSFVSSPPGASTSSFIRSRASSTSSSCPAACARPMALMQSIRGLKSSMTLLARSARAELARSAPGAQAARKKLKELGADLFLLLHVCWF